MRALRYEGPASGVSFLRNTPEPEVREGEALVRPLRMAIGSADVLLAARKPGIPGVTMGREFVGIVERIGAGKGPREKGPSLVGKRVVASSCISCGECDLCQRGLAAHCRSRAVVGLFGRDGCFADRLVMPLRSLLAVPNEVDDDHAVFAESLASAVHAAQQLRIEGKPYITVLGDGDLALLCGQVMNRLNASVRIVGWQPSRADLTAKWGVKHRLERDIGRRADQDVVVDCTGTPEGFDLALKLVRPRGKVLVKGLLHASVASAWTIDLSPIATSEIEVIGSASGPIGEALEVLKRREVDIVSLISKRIRLEDSAEGLRTAARGEAVKVLIEP
ncbi:MAG: alcohol dehydrogenase catalytic domain-containing protein [Phycisphaerae bacterium]|nr:alcohol dehydrogenase catalytic domain-containing protein [Phycisphaerae bacterium]